MLTKFHVSEKLFGELMSLPLWVKLSLFLDLKSELSHYLSGTSLENLGTEEPIALYTPRLTVDGENFLKTAPSDSMMKPLLSDCKMNLSTLDLCLRHHLSLADFCEQILRAIDQRWVVSPQSTKTCASLEYLAGRIRIGEYLVKAGFIRPEQLDQALRAQKYIDEAMDDHTKLANILINLGYITRKDSETILFLKAESQKQVPKSPLWDLL